MIGAKWQPIETAPKDGTYILGTWIDAESNYRNIIKIAYHTGYCIWDSNCHWPKCEPTHWMPLPEDPQETK